MVNVKKNSSKRCISSQITVLKNPFYDLIYLVCYEYIMCNSCNEIIMAVVWLIAMALHINLGVLFYIVNRGFTDHLQ